MYGRQGNPRILLPPEPKISFTNPQNTGGLQLDLSLLLNNGRDWNLISTLRPSGPQSDGITLSQLSPTQATISWEGYSRSELKYVNPYQAYWFIGGILIEAVHAASRGRGYSFRGIYKSQMDELAKGLR